MAKEKFERGKPHGRPRVKFLTVEEMLAELERVTP